MAATLRPGCQPIRKLELESMTPQARDNAHADRGAERQNA
jgi:hypothetical protein